MEQLLSDTELEATRNYDIWEKGNIGVGPSDHQAFCREAYVKLWRKEGETEPNHLAETKSQTEARVSKVAGNCRAEFRGVNYAEK